MIVLFPYHCFSMYSKPDQTLKTHDSIASQCYLAFGRPIFCYNGHLGMSKVIFCILVYFFCSIQILYNKQRPVVSSFHARAEIKLLKQLYTELQIAP